MFENTPHKTPDVSDNASTTPHVITDGTGRQSLPFVLSQLIRKPLVWVTAGVVVVVLIGGSTVLYLTAHHATPPKTTTTEQPASSGTNEQSTPTTDTQTSQTTPAADSPKSTPATTTTPKSGSTKTTTGTTTTNNSGSTNNTGGSSGGNTPPGPIALKIMPLGDSITQGGVGDPQTVNGYRLQLWNDLGSAYQIDYVGSWQNGDSQLSDKDVNGFSGDCIKTSPCHGDPTLYSRTAGWITTEDPDLVIMQGGGNDFVDPSMTETLVETYMEDWISLVFATKPSVKIVVMGAPQWYPNYSTALQNYVDQLKTAGKPIRYVQYDTVTTVDGTHPTLAGYVTLGDALAPMVRELFP
jgi:lysophospholipase L1-like esterase